MTVSGKSLMYNKNRMRPKTLPSKLVLSYFLSSTAIMSDRPMCLQETGERPIVKKKRRKADCLSKNEE